MNLCFVIQRYGLESPGGAETHCRWLASRLAHRHRVEVVTTCARDYTDWSNHYPAGVSEVLGLKVTRFPVDRPRSERLFDFSFRLAARRKARGKRGQLTCVDKANVFKAFAYFRKIFDERAARFPEVAAGHIYIDACSAALVRRPWDFDVLVTENMFGDILSDLAAGLIGGMGMAPSADIGDRYAVFQPSHGSAPDIAGQGIANPMAAILSAAMMLEWLHMGEAAAHIQGAVRKVFAGRAMRTPDMGGSMSTREMTDAIISALP